MAISMGAALLGSAIIGGVGSAVAGSKNSKAIKQAQAAQTDANAQSLAAQQQARNENKQYQNPFYQTGLAANNRINALLGLGSTGPMDSPQMGGYNFGNPNVPQGTPGYMGGSGFGDGAIERQYEDYGNIGGGMPQEQGYPQFEGGYQSQGYAPQTGQVAQQPNELAAAQQGFSDWRNNTGYDFRFNQGVRAIDAGAPVRNSGSTLKARAQYGQDIGSAEFYNYLGALTGQQQVGTGAANALSGVNTTYANNASNIAQNQGQNIANSAIARANNSSNMIGGITSSFGNALGSYAGYKGW